ncbi:unnamed protein product [Paramecium sonneborni]|uniref:Uncharacterized protein n=1 Tax=Paramecium sonneborni TaxID=65129 RepID=A0A8S1RD50_9CILI|nr:unnamed protein product [Paramecium sonneborni]
MNEFLQQLFEKSLCIKQKENIMYIISTRYFIKEGKKVQNNIDVKVFLKSNLLKLSIIIKKFTKQKGNNLNQYHQIILILLLYQRITKGLCMNGRIKSFNKLENQQRFNFLYKCLSINLSLDFLILLDYYKENQLHIMQIIDAQSKSVYQTQSQVPFQTKMQVIVNGINTYIIYAQHFSKFSILSLLSAQIYNLSCWNNEFIDFGTSIKIYPNNYILNSDQVLQFSISAESTFQLQATFKLVYRTLQAIINVYYIYQTYSQCDSILVQQLEYQSYRPDLIQLWGCENQKISWKEMVPYQSKLILQNNQFIIQYTQDEIRISSQSSQSFEYQLSSQDNSQLYFNAILYIFIQLSIKSHILLYKSTQLIKKMVDILLNLQFVSAKFIKFLNYAQKYLLKITLQVCFKMTQTFMQCLIKIFSNIIILGKVMILKFESFSGQLLNYKLNQDQSLLNSKQQTFNKAFKINQTLQLAQILQINQKFNKVQYFFIGYNNQSFDIFNCDFIYYYKKTSKSCMKLSSINISIKAQALKVSIYPEVIIIGLSDYDTIYLFKQYYVDSNEYSQSSLSLQQNSQILQSLI